MGTLITDLATVIKSYNNNIVSVKVNGNERILFGKGVGFSKKFGDIIKKGTEVEKIFVIDDEDNQQDTYLINSIIKYTEEKTKIKIDKSSLDYARFLVHLKFAMKRIEEDIDIRNDFVTEIKGKYRLSYKIAEGASKILVKNFGKKVKEDEIAYLTMHIERLRVSAISR